jgi:Ca2+-binding RTX toxin-like protein
MLRNTNKSKRSSPPRSLRAAVAPVVEAMEPRRMLSASITDGELLVIGDTPGGQINVWADAIYVHTVADGQHDVFVTPLVKSIRVHSYDAGVITIGSNLPVSDVEVEGSYKNDMILIGDTPGVTVMGGSGNDFINGGSLADHLSGGIGDDTVNGGGGDDTILGDDIVGYATADKSGNDLLHGGTGKDTLYGGAYVDELYGDQGEDSLHGGDHADFMEGGADNDVMDGRESYNKGSYSDHMVAGHGDDSFIGDENDYADYSAYTLPIRIAYDDGYTGAVGEHDSLGVRNIIGGKGDDYIDLSYWDTCYISGGPGNDVLIGGSETDWYWGDGDGLYGGEGNDFIYGRGGMDHLVGGPGNDFLDGGRDADEIEGGAGYDIISYALRTKAVHVTLDGLANDGEINHGENYGESEFDWVGADIEEIRGGTGNDTLEGDAYNNSLIGNGGNDVLRGNGGNDYLSGGFGNDSMNGGLGADEMFGGFGNDTATYTSRTVNVFLSLDNAANDGEAFEGDNIRGDVETLAGGSSNDVLTGNAYDNALFGNGGNDLMRGLGGNDLMYGGAGVDTATYTERAWGVNVSLDGLANDGTPAAGRIGAPAEFDNVVAENVIGTLIGDADANELIGYGGNDSLSGGGGYDTLDGGTGNDTLDGGSGADKMYGGEGDDRFFAADYWLDTLWGGAGNDTASVDAFDLINEIEHFV